MFILKDSKTASTQIILSYQCADGKLRLSTSCTIKSNQWNKSTQRCEGKSPINKLLNRIATHIQAKEESKLSIGKPILKAELRAEVLQIIGHAEKKPNEYILPYAEKLLMRRMDGNELTASHKRFSSMTLKGYKTSINHLIKFEHETKQRLTFSGFGQDQWQQLIAWFNQSNYTINSIGKHTKNLKVFIASAYTDGLHDNTAFRKFSVPNELTNDIYLTESEINAMHGTLGLDYGHQIALDWFTIECFTGLRISDIKRLKMEHVEKGMISIANEKTDETVVIPLHPHIKRILEKYRGFPPKISEQKINVYIKQIGRLAGITTPVLYTVTKGGVRVDEYIPKCDMISNHTGRRSFITNLLRQGVAGHIIMALTGIKKTSTLDRYNKLSKSETAEIAAGFPYSEKIASNSVMSVQKVMCFLENFSKPAWLQLVM